MDDASTPLGAYLKDRRARLDPASFGFTTQRRRTPGLRREEVAQLACVSTTWYTWLEQGRGGPPSADVLDRLSRAFQLTETEREHLFLLAQHRPPAVRPAPRGGVTSRVQRVLDSLTDTPAFVKTPEWTVVAWNRAAAAVFGDYATLPARERNVLRRIFARPAQTRLPGWQDVARAAVASFRRDALRAGMPAESRQLLDELGASSPEFLAMWQAQDVTASGEGLKHIAHPEEGVIALDYSSYTVDGHPELALVIYLPATEADRDKIRRAQQHLP